MNPKKLQSPMNPMKLQSLMNLAKGLQSRLAMMKMGSVELGLKPL